MNEQEFAQRLRQYRKDKGLTQQELADQLGYPTRPCPDGRAAAIPT